MVLVEHKISEHETKKIDRKTDRDIQDRFKRRRMYNIIIIYDLTASFYFLGIDAFILEYIFVFQLLVIDSEIVTRFSYVHNNHNHIHIHFFFVE